jgi:hypothetical protein
MQLSANPLFEDISVKFSDGLDEGPLFSPGSMIPEAGEGLFRWREESSYVAVHRRRCVLSQA